MSERRADVDSMAGDLLDGVITPEAAMELSDAIERDPGVARRVVQLALLHDALDREHRDAVIGRAHAWRWRALAMARRALAAAAVLAVAAIVAFGLFRTASTARASDVVARLMSAAREGDRTYVLRADSEGKALGRRRDERESAARQRAAADGRRTQAPIDGALLTVRDPNLYVLVRTDADGRQVVTGCDGRRAWAVASDGPVRTSDDVRRFSGAVPGSRIDLPFIDPHESLSGLAAGYDLDLRPPAPLEGQPWPRIVGTRKAHAKGGPRTIEIAYDAETGVIHAMRLGQLPQARGGPRAIVLELVDQASLPDSFYSHDSHHEASRPVLKE